MNVILRSQIFMSGTVALPCVLVEAIVKIIGNISSWKHEKEVKVFQDKVCYYFILLKSELRILQKKMVAAFHMSLAVHMKILAISEDHFSFKAKIRF